MTAPRKRGLILTADTARKKVELGIPPHADGDFCTFLLQDSHGAALSFRRISLHFIRGCPPKT